MFNSIAPRYDLLNHVLSANVDRLWWRQDGAPFPPVLANPDAAVLDICCGTGDMTMALLKHRPARRAPDPRSRFCAGHADAAERGNSTAAARWRWRPTLCTCRCARIAGPDRHAHSAFAIWPTTKPACASSIACSSRAGNWESSTSANPAA